MAHSNTGTAQRSICIAGVYQKSDKYPNVKYKIEGLEALGVEFFEINKPALESTKAWGQGGLKLRSLVSFFNVVRVLVGCIRTRKKISVLYLPYPSVFISFALSFLPGPLRPYRIVCDLFISLYDTVVIDRALLEAKSLRARLLWWIERRSLTVADSIVVDTPQNAQYVSELFNIDISKIVSVPLSIGHLGRQEEWNVGPTAKSRIDVLFVGTMIPLHGIDIILNAAEKLQIRKNIHFTLIGDGQEGYLVEEYLGSGAAENVTWIRDWQSREQLEGWIHSSDICLGVFALNKKTQRICPFKLYHYLHAKKPVITGDTDWTKSVVSNEINKPFVLVPVGQPDKLAEAVEDLADSIGKRAELAECGGRFYEKVLSNECAAQSLKHILSNCGQN